MICIWLLPVSRQPEKHNGMPPANPAKHCQPRAHTLQHALRAMKTRQTKIPHKSCTNFHGNPVTAHTYVHMHSNTTPYSATVSENSVMPAAAAAAACESECICFKGAQHTPHHAAQPRNTHTTCSLPAIPNKPTLEQQVSLGHVDPTCLAQSPAVGAMNLGPPPKQKVAAASASRGAKITPCHARQLTDELLML